MRLTCFVVWKSWVSNPLRTALSVLGVALGVAIVTAIHVMDHNTIESQLRLLRPNFGRVDLELAPLEAGREPVEVMRALERRTDLAAVGLLQQAVAEVRASDRQFMVPVYGLSPLPSNAFTHYMVAEGEDLSSLDGDQGVLVGAQLAAMAGITPGDRLELATPRAAPRTICRDGVRIPVDRPPGEGHEPVRASVVVKGVLADVRLGARDSGVLVVTSFALARQLSPAGQPLYQINRREGVDVDRLRQDLAAEFEVLDHRSALLGEASDERAFRNGVKVIGCLALVMGMFVIFQTLSQSLVARLKQIGLLRALGTTRGTVAGVFLLDASATAVLGALLGLAGGVALAAVLTKMGISTLGRGKPIVTFELPWTPMLWTALIGVSFTLAGGAFPLWKARNLPALDVLAARGIGAGGGAGEAYVLRGVNLFLFTMLVLVLPGAYLAMTPILADEGAEARIVLVQLGGMILLFGGVLLVAPKLVQTAGALLLRPLRRLMPLPVFLVGRFLQQSPGRFAAAVCGLSVVLMALLALKSITYGLRGEAVQFGREAMQRKLFLKCSPVDRAEAKSLVTIPGVVRTELFEGQAIMPRFPLRGLELASLTREGGLLAGDDVLAAAYEGQRGLIVSKRLAHLRGLAPGDPISLRTDQGGAVYTVLAVSDRAGYFPDERAWGVASPRWLQRDFCVGLDGIDQIALELEPGVSPTTALAAARRLLPTVPWAKSGAEVTAYNVRDVTMDFVLFDVLLGLILVLAGLGLVNTMTIAAMGRAREIGVLRALGMGKSSLRSTFLIEGGLVAVLSSVLALVLAVPLGMVVIEGLNRVAGLDAPFVVPWTYVVAVPGAACAVAVLASILPGVRALRESPAEAVRYE